jgi:hypothetical protein
MATEILRPQDCLRPQHFYDPFSPTKPFPNRRKSRPIRTNQALATPSPNPKHGRPNPKSNRKSTSPSPSTSPLSTSPPSTSPLSTSPVQDGFRLLKRGEAFRPVQTGSEKRSPVESKRLSRKHEPSLVRPQLGSPLTEKAPFLRRSEPPPSRLEKTPPQKKNQSDRTRLDHATLPPKPVLFESDKDLCFAGPNFAVRAPEASCLPQPGFLLRSSSVGPTSDDEASRALRSLLKLQFL